MNTDFTMVSYHFIIYFGFLLVFFGGLDFELGFVTPLVFGLDPSMPGWASACMVSCIIPAVISATLSFRDFRLFSNRDAGSNLNGVCARIWFRPSNPTGWLWNVDIMILTYLFYMLYFTLNIWLECYENDSYEVRHSKIEFLIGSSLQPDPHSASETPASANQYVASSIFQVFY